jgi:hypothetical protein
MRKLSNILEGYGFKKWLIDTYVEPRIIYGLEWAEPREALICNDGFTMSVQGGVGIYSEPGEFGVNFTHMEIGFPSEYEELIVDYAESNDYTKTVYPYVPVLLICDVIKKHGGIKKN